MDCCCNTDMTPLQIFRIVAPEFNDIGDDDVLSYFSLFKIHISKRKFGKAYNQALAYLTAHKLKMMGYGVDDANVGTIATSLRLSSASEGETSVSFGTNQSTMLQPDAEYTLTIYGLEYLTLLRNSIVPIVSAGETFGF